MAKAELRILQKLNDYEFGVELWAMRSGRNENSWSFQNMEQHYLTILSTPILCAFPNGRIGDGHLMEERTDANGEQYYSFIAKPGLEQIVGTISDDPKDVRLEEKDGEIWIVAQGRLFTFYAKELVDYIVSVGKMSVSVEAEILGGYTDENDPSLEVFTDWKILGVTILGSGVAPAIPGANIQAIKSLASDFEEMKLKVASLIKAAEEDTPDESDGDVPEGEEGEEGDIEEEDGQDEDPDGEETNKPQNENNSKGEKSMNLFSKRQTAEIAPTFEGYSVLAAGQSDAGYHFCLMADNGTAAAYTMASLDDVIDPKKITTLTAKVSYAFGEDSIEVDSAEMTDLLGNALVAANSETERLSGELKAAQDTIEAMKTAEMKRRVSAAKAAAKSALERFNENHEEKVGMAILEAINEKIDNGDYSECTNAEGEWCGEELVSEAVLAKCAKEVIEQDKARVARNSTHYIWDSSDKADGAAGDDVSALLAKWKAKSIR